MKQPMRKMPMFVQPRDSGWVELGTKTRLGVIPESISFSGDLTEGGCSEASCLLRVDPNLDKVEIEHFTPVTYGHPFDPSWSGRIIGTPTNYGAESIVHVNMHGWYQHLKDDFIDKIWVVQNMSRFVSTSDSPSLTLTTVMQRIGVDTNGAGITFSFDNNTYVRQGWTSYTASMDLGPNNLVKRVLFDWDLTAIDNVNWTIYCRVSDTVDAFAASGTTDISTHNAPATSATNQGGTASTARRYLHFFLYRPAGGDGNFGNNGYCRIKNVRVFTDTADESGNASILKASTVIGETLTAGAPLISTDQSLITTTSFVIPNFPAEFGYKTAADLIAGANAYHDYQFRLTAEAVPRAEYRAIPTDPAFVVGGRDDYEFANPAENDGREVYSRVLCPYEDASGVPAVASPAGSSQTVFERSGTQFTNPSFDTDVSGWSGSGAITRDTGVFQSSPASARVGVGDTMFTSSGLTGSNYRAGRDYRFSVWAKDGTFTVTITAAGAKVLATQAFTAGASFEQCTVDFVTGTVGGSADYGNDQITYRIEVGGAATAYFDSFELLEPRKNVVDRRGFVRTLLKPMSSKSTLAAATQVAQLELDAHQFPPFKGTIVVRGRIRRKGSSESIPVCDIPKNVGDVVLLEDLFDPNTGARGRQGVIVRATYNHDENACTLELDAPKDQIDILRTKYAALAAQVFV